MKKKIFAIASFIMILTLLVINVEAKEIDNLRVVNISDDIKVIADIPEEYINSVTEEELINIAIENNLKNGERIAVEKVGYIEEIGLQERADWKITYPTRLTKSGSEYVKRDDFVISVARGEEKTLSKRFSATVKSSISGSYYSLNSQLSSSLKATFEITQKWKGPDSPYNSTEYRVKFYAQKYNYEQDRCLDGYVSGTKKGTVIKPTRYLSYSIDRKV